MAIMAEISPEFEQELEEVEADSKYESGLQVQSRCDDVLDIVRKKLDVLEAQAAFDHLLLSYQACFDCDKVPDRAYQYFAAAKDKYDHRFLDACAAKLHAAGISEEAYFNWLQDKSSEIHEENPYCREYAASTDFEELEIWTAELRGEAAAWEAEMQKFEEHLEQLKDELENVRTSRLFMLLFNLFDLRFGVSLPLNLRQAAIEAQDSEDYALLQSWVDRLSDRAVSKDDFIAAALEDLQQDQAENS